VPYHASATKKWLTLIIIAYYFIDANVSFQPPLLISELLAVIDEISCSTSTINVMDE